LKPLGGFVNFLVSHFGDMLYRIFRFLSLPTYFTRYIFRQPLHFFA